MDIYNFGNMVESTFQNTDIFACHTKWQRGSMKYVWWAW